MMSNELKAQIVATHTVECLYAEQVCGEAVDLGLLESVMVVPGAPGVVMVGPYLNDFYNDPAHAQCAKYVEDNTEGDWNDDAGRAVPYLREPNEEALRKIFR
jgi:hypothetical protein